MADDKPKTIRVLTVFFKNGKQENFHDVETFSSGGDVLAFEFGPIRGDDAIVGRGFAHITLANVAGFAEWDMAPDDPKPER